MDKVYLVFRRPNTGPYKYLCATFSNRSYAEKYRTAQAALILSGQTYSDEDKALELHQYFEGQFEIEEARLEDHIFNNEIVHAEQI